MEGRAEFRRQDRTAVHRVSRNGRSSHREFRPGFRRIAGAAAPAAGAVYIASVAIGLWLGRADRLPARGPLIVLTTVHAATLTIGMYSFFNGAIGKDQVPSVMSLFGLIHFESIIFFVGTAVFLLSLVRERSEAAEFERLQLLIR